MASIQKFTHDAMCSQSCHVNREYDTPSNKDIDPERTALNYSFPMNHNGMSNFEYYKELISEKYLYGRGSRREKDAITGCGWVVTLPKEIHGDSEKENAFFSSVYSFVSERYGEENIIANSVHYDEAGLPHIHIVFCPVTTLDHDVVQNKTVKTSNAIQLESGRYEYTYRFKFDENGEKIPLKNYARMSDYYDEKIDANSVLNKAELQHFHTDLQKYLSDNGIEGSVITGKTRTNFSVKELKEFTSKTGLHLDKIQEFQGDKSLLESYADYANKSMDLTATEARNAELEKKLTDLEQALTSTHQLLSESKETILSQNRELQAASERVKALETELLQTKSKLIEFKSAQKDYTWGEDSSWGNNSSNTQKSYEEEKLW